MEGLEKFLTDEPNTRQRKKTIYGLRLRQSDEEPWSDPHYYRSKKQRDKAESINRIIGGIRTHKFENRVYVSEVDDFCD